MEDLTERIAAFLSAGGLGYGSYGSYGGYGCGVFETFGSGSGRGYKRLLNMTFEELKKSRFITETIAFLNLKQCDDQIPVSLPHD